MCVATVIFVFVLLPTFCCMICCYSLRVSRSRHISNVGSQPQDTSADANLPVVEALYAHEYSQRETQPRQSTQATNSCGNDSPLMLQTSSVKLGTEINSSLPVLARAYAVEDNSQHTSSQGQSPNYSENGRTERRRNSPSSFRVSPQSNRIHIQDMHPSPPSQPAEDGLSAGAGAAGSPSRSSVRPSQAIAYPLSSTTVVVSTYTDRQQNWVLKTINEIVDIYVSLFVTVSELILILRGSVFIVMSSLSRHYYSDVYAILISRWMKVL